MGLGSFIVIYFTVIYFLYLFREDYIQALQLKTSHLPARVNLALLLQHEGKFQEAWNDLTSALAVDGKYVPALEARAIICLQMGNYFGAFMDLTTALEVSHYVLVILCSISPQIWLMLVLCDNSDHTKSSDKKNKLAIVIHMVNFIQNINCFF